MESGAKPRPQKHFPYILSQGDVFVGKYFGSFCRNQTVVSPESCTGGGTGARRTGYEVRGIKVRKISTATV